VAGYVLADVEWFDDQGRARYVELLGPTLEQYGGEFVAGTRDVRVKEGDWEHRGILVLIRFPTLDSAVEWYHSSEYEPALQVRKASSRSRLLIFEGD
jgi:uncharacterized protein (DUF1330 family)